MTGHRMAAILLVAATAGVLGSLIPAASAQESPIYLGVNVQNVDAPQAAGLGVLARHGALMVKVFPSYPADRAGLRAGDVVVVCGNRRVNTADDLQAAIRGSEVGSSHRVLFYRGAQLYATNVLVGMSPIDPPPPPTPVTHPPDGLPSRLSGHPVGGLHAGVAPGGFPATGGPAHETYLGLRARSAGHPDAVAAGIESPLGAAIVAVTPDGPAALAGLRRGDLIVQWGGREIQTYEDLEAAARRSPAGSRQRIVFVRGYNRYTVEMPIVTRPLAEPLRWYAHPTGGYWLLVPRGWTVSPTVVPDGNAENAYDPIESTEKAYVFRCFHKQWEAGDLDAVLDAFVRDKYQQHPEARSGRFPAGAAAGAWAAYAIEEEGRRFVLYRIALVGRGRRYVINVTAPVLSDPATLPGPIGDVLAGVECPEAPGAITPPLVQTPPVIPPIAPPLVQTPPVIPPIAPPLVQTPPVIPPLAPPLVQTPPVVPPSAPAGGLAQPNDPPPPLQPPVEETLTQTRATVPPEGGTLALDDGALVRIAPGAAAPREVTLRKIGGERFFGGPGRLAYEVSGLEDGAEVSFQAVLPPGIDPDNVYALTYDADALDRVLDEAKARAPAGTASGATGAGRPTALPVTYNPATGQATASAQIKGQRLDAGPPARRFAFGYWENYYGKHDVHTLLMPYCEQVAGSCWATDTMLLQRRLTRWRSIFEDYEVPHILRCLGVSNRDYGLGPHQIKFYLPGHLARTTGYDFETFGCATEGDLRDKILRQLDKDRPVLYAWSGHAVLLLGYRKIKNPDGSLADLEILIHDTKNMDPPTENDGTMYTWVPWKWINGRNWMYTSIVYPIDDPPADFILQTIGYPSQGDVGTIEFLATHPNTKRDYILAKYAWDVEGPPRHMWIPGAMIASSATGAETVAEPSDRIDPIPATATRLNLRLPMWNADVKPADVRVRLLVRHEGGKRIHEEPERAFTLPAEGVSHYECAIDADTLRRTDDADAKGNCLLRVDVDMRDAQDRYLDGFYFDANIAAVPPEITAHPPTAATGSPITISGKRFGSKPGEGTVLIGGVPLAAITAWTDTKIEGTVPESLTAGTVPLVVTVHGHASKPASIEVVVPPKPPAPANRTLALLQKCDGVVVMLIANVERVDGDVVENLILGGSGLSFTWNGLSFKATHDETDAHPNGSIKHMEISGVVSADGERVENFHYLSTSRQKNGGAEYRLEFRAGNFVKVAESTDGNPNVFVWYLVPQEKLAESFINPELISRGYDPPGTDKISWDRSAKVLKVGPGSMNKISITFRKTKPP